MYFSHWQISLGSVDDKKEANVKKWEGDVNIVIKESS